MNHPFDTDENGNIISNPMTGYHAIPVMGTSILLKLEYATSQNHLTGIFQNQQDPESTQLVLTPTQAQALAEQLQKFSDQIVKEAMTNTTRRS